MKSFLMKLFLVKIIKLKKINYVTCGDVQMTTLHHFGFPLSQTQSVQGFGPGI